LRTHACRRRASTASGPIARIAERASRSGGNSFGFKPLPVRGEKEIMQQLPPFPDTPSNPEPIEPSQPGQPTPAPQETPPHGPDVDVPSPPSPGTEPPTTPISPVG